MSLPQKGSIHMSIVDAMYKQNVPMTADQIQALSPRIKPYKPVGLLNVMRAMTDAGYIELIGDMYSLTQPTHDALSSKKFKGSVATPRYQKDFAPMTNYFAFMHCGRVSV